MAATAEATETTAATTTETAATTEAATTTETAAVVATTEATTTTEAETKAVVPEAYALTVPDGEAFDLDSFIARAKAKGWTQDQAQQELTDTLTVLNEQGTRFASEVAAHPEIGGTQIEQTKEFARRALDRFLPPGTPERERFTRDMAHLRSGDYLPWALLVARVGKALQEDGHVAGAGAAGTVKKSLAERLAG